MKRTGIFLSIAVIIFLILLFSGGFYTVSEWEQVVITQFGRTVGEPKIESGLKFKIPFIQDIHRYEKRIMRWDGDPKEIPTRDKRFIYVDTTARWRIIDPQKFLEVLGTYTLTGNKNGQRPYRNGTRYREKHGRSAFVSEKKVTQK